MALFDPADPRRALIGRPTLRRNLRDLPDDRARALVDRVSAEYDPQRFKGAYRDSLQRAIDTERSAEPLAERDRLNTLLRDPRLSGDERSQIDARLRRLPNPNSVDARFDPRDPNSVAFRQFGTLYRDV